MDNVVVVVYELSAVETSGAVKIWTPRGCGGAIFEYSRLCLSGWPTRGASETRNKHAILVTLANSIQIRAAHFRRAALRERAC